MKSKVNIPGTRHVRVDSTWLEIDRLQIAKASRIKIVFFIIAKRKELNRF